MEKNTTPKPIEKEKWILLEKVVEKARHLLLSWKGSPSEIQGLEKQLQALSDFRRSYVYPSAPLDAEAHFDKLLKEVEELCKGQKVKLELIKESCRFFLKDIKFYKNG